VNPEALQLHSSFKFYITLDLQKALIFVVQCVRKDAPMYRVGQMQAARPTAALFADSLEIQEEWLLR